MSVYLQCMCRKASVSMHDCHVYHHEECAGDLLPRQEIRVAIYSQSLVDSSLPVFVMLRWKVPCVNHRVLVFCYWPTALLQSELISHLKTYHCYYVFVEYVCCKIIVNFKKTIY